MAMIAGHNGLCSRLPVQFLVASLSMLTAAMHSGCASPTKPRWQASATPVGAKPIGGAKEASNSALPGRRGPSKPTAPSNGEATGDDSDVVLTSGEEVAEDRVGITATVIPPAVREYPIDLTAALRLAEVENPLIAQARQRIGETLAVQQGARALLLPSLNIGTNYHNHTGDLQRSSGRILKLTEKSLYFGGGTGVLAASTAEVPAVSIYSQLTDAIFEPLAAHQLVERSRFNASATANTILLEVSEQYFELLAAESDLIVRRESAAQELEVARLTRAYAKAGQGREADAERSETELRLIIDEIQQAEEAVAVASARLAHRLHFDQTVRIRPIAPIIDELTIVDPASPLPTLIETALRRRPEVGAAATALSAAEIHHKQERYRPLLPTVWVGFSGGAFGGGSNLTGPELAHFAGRTDFDVEVFWTLRNFGIGNLSLQKRRLAEVGQAVGEQSRAVAAIRSEVAAAYADVTATRRQLELTALQLKSAQAGFAEDLERIRNTVARPIEVVNSLQLLNEARVARIRAVTDYNKAEFRLFVFLGSPPPLSETANLPIPPAPIATPDLRPS